jgi:hypothetical protein
MELQATFEQILPKGHPSFGTQKAVFLFGLGNGPTRILSVEATNPWAVLCLERLLLADGRASANCRVLQVVRDYRNVGTRDEMTEEVPFVDFMLDIADMDRFLGGTNDDTLVLEAFKRSLSDAERQVATLKLQAIRQAPERDIFEGFEMPASDTFEVTPAAPVASEDQADKLTSALVGLGFKKTEVRQFVTQLGTRTQTDNLHSLLREGLRALAA